MWKSRANSSEENFARRGDLPSAAELLTFIRESPSAVGKREIARAFAVAPGNRPELRDMLRNIERSGAVTRAANRRFVAPPPPPQVPPLHPIPPHPHRFPPPPPLPPPR